MQVGATLLFLCAATAAFAVGSQSEEDEGLDEGVRRARAYCNFTLSLLKQISENETNSNVIFSPASIGILLSVLQQGARGNTAVQLQELLRLSPAETLEAYGKFVSLREGEDVPLEWGNKCYVRPGFDLDEAFRKTAKTGFNVDFEEMDFGVPSSEESAATINDWVKEVTHGRIADLVDPSLLTPEAVMVLVNAVFFKGAWVKLFKKSKTAEHKFELAPDNSVQTLFMSQRGHFYANRDSYMGVKWIQLPFKGEGFAMVFALPTKKHQLDRLIRRLTDEDLHEILTSHAVSQVKLRIPKFKLSGKVSLVSTLQELGLTDLFSPASDLGGLSPRGSPQVSEMIHKADVEIDEKGTTATAATVITLTRMRTPSLSFVADQPFLFFIVDTLGNVPLFAGKVVNPSP